MLPIQSDEPGGGAFSALHGGSVAEAVAGQGPRVTDRQAREFCITHRNFLSVF